MTIARITLKRDKEKSILRRHPWVFSGAIARKDKDLRDDWSQQYKIWIGADFAVNNQISIKGKVIARSHYLKTKKFEDERNGQRIEMEGDATGFTVDVEFKF